MPANALDKVVSFAGEVLFERKSPTAEMQEATLCEQINLPILGKSEIPNTQGGNTFLIANLTKQVLNSPNTSMLVAALIKNCAQQKTGNVEYHLVSHIRFTDSWCTTRQPGTT